MDLAPVERLAALHAAATLAAATVEGGWRTAALALCSVLGFLALVVFAVRGGGGSTSPPTTKKDGASSDGDDAATTKFRLVVTDIRRGSDGKVQYRIEGAFGEERWSCWRRYSELRIFAKRLGRKDEFPEKSTALEWMRGADLDVGFVDNRRRRLNAFLKEAVPDRAAFEALLAQPLMREVLGVPDTVKSSAQVGLTLKEASALAIESLRMTESRVKYAVTENGGDGWNLYRRDADGVACFIKKDGDKTFAMGRGPLDFPKEKALSFLSNVQVRPKWDDLFKAQRDLQIYQKPDPAFSYGPNEDPLETGASAEYEVLALVMQHTMFSSPAKAIVAERDSVCVAVSARRRKDGALMIGLKSCEDPRAPEGVDGYVRAKVIVAGFLFEDRTDGKPGCIMTSVGEVDPNGNIPSWIVNTIAPQRGFVSRDINTCMAKNPSDF